MLDQDAIDHARELAEDIWLDRACEQASAKSLTCEALKYVAKYWDGLNFSLGDSRIDMHSNAVERAIFPIALQRKNALFGCHDAGAQNWEMLASFIKACKLHRIEPQNYLSGAGLRCP